MAALSTVTPLLFPDFGGGPVILLCSGSFSGTCDQPLGLGLGLGRESRPLRLRIQLHVSRREDARERQYASPRTQSATYGPSCPENALRPCASLVYTPRLGDATFKYVTVRWTWP